MSNEDKNKRIARNTLFLYIRMCFVMLIALYTTRTVLRVLGSEDYGVFNVVCGFVSLFGLFNTCFSTAINRYYNYEIGQKTDSGVNTVYNTSIRIQAVLAALIVLLVFFIGNWYIDNKMVLPLDRIETAKWIFRFSLISMFLTVLQAPYSAAVLAFEKMDFYAIVSILDAVLKLGFVIMLQFVGNDKLLLYGILMCIVSGFNFLLYFIYCRTHFTEMRLKRHMNKKMAKSMLTFAGWSALDPAAYMVRDQGTNMVLNVFFGPIVNAAQAIAYQVSAAVESFSGSFSTSFRPQIIQSYSEGLFDRSKNLMYSMSKINYALHAMFVVPLIFEMDYVLNLWLGDGFPKYAISFACLILVIKSIGSLNSPISIIVAATGNIKTIKIYSAITIASILPVSILLFKVGFPPEAVYFALIIITIVNQIGCVIIMHKVLPFITIKDYLMKIIYPLAIHTICILVLPLIIWCVFTPSLWRLLLLCFGSIIGTMISFFLLVLNSTEKIILGTFIRTFLNKIGKKVM